MSDEVVHGLSAESKRIPSKWNRQTVADGSWLQKYTLNPLSARDVYLAEQIDKGTSALSAAISAEVERATSAEYELQYQIDLMNAATDVINVFGTYSDFSSQSSWYFDPAHSASYHLTDNDIIKIINDEYTEIPIGDGSSSATGHQTYFQWRNNPGVSGDPISPSDGTWNFIGFTDPYYNTAEIDEYFKEFSGSISSNYYASGNIIASVNLYATHINSTNEPPKIVIGTKDEVTFKSVTTTSLSSQLVTAVNLSSNNISATNISATTLSASTAYGQSAKFDNISATHLSALTAQGNSAKFDNINSTNLTTNNISSTNLSALSAYGTQAIYNNISAQVLSGSTTSINVDNLISAATAGAVAYSGENGIYVTAHKIGLSGDYENAVKEGSAASAYIYSHSGDFLNSAHSAYNQLTFKFGNTTKDYKANNSAYAFTFSAGEGINFITGTNQITITSNDTTYQGSTYISTANNIISVADNLIGSAQSGKAAWNILSGTKISAVGTSFPNTGFGNLSAGFRISAGNNLTISTASNTIILDAKDTGITSISAKTGSSTTSFSGPNVNLSAGEGVGFNFGTNLLTISAEGKTYAAGDYISITGNTNKINVTGALINSAQAGQSAYNWLTANTDGLSAKWAKNATSATIADSATSAYNSQNLGGVTSTNIIGSAQSGKDAWNKLSTATFTANGTTAKLSGGFNLSAGQGITIIHNAGEQKIVISAEGSTYHNGNYIEVDNTNKQINLSSNISATNISSDNIVLSKQTIGQGSYTTNLSFSSMYMTTYAQPSYELLFNGVNVSAVAPDQSYPGTPKPTVTAAVKWYDLIKKSGGNYVSASGNQSITLATADATLVPTAMSDNIIYLV